MTEQVANQVVKIVPLALTAGVAIALTDKALSRRNSRMSYKGYFKW